MVTSKEGSEQCVDMQIGKKAQEKKHVYMGFMGLEKVYDRSIGRPNGKY